MSLLKTPPLLSVIIPVYNEKNTILEILRRVRDVKIEKEIIIVDDSTDETREILKNIKDENIQVIFNKKRLGKGAAVRKGFSLAKGDIVIIQDADLEYSPSDYHKLIQPIIEGKADVVFGSRVFSKCAKSNLRYYIGGKFWHVSNRRENLLTVRETCCVLRVAYCVLRGAYCVLRGAKKLLYPVR